MTAKEIRWRRTRLEVCFCFSPFYFFYLFYFYLLRVQLHEGAWLQLFVRLQGQDGKIGGLDEDAHFDVVLLPGEVEVEDEEDGDQNDDHHSGNGQADDQANIGWGHYRN